MGPDGSWSRLQGILVQVARHLGVEWRRPHPSSLSDLIRAEPGDLLGFSSGTWLATDDPAAEDQGDDPTAHVLVHTTKRLRLDLQAGLLPNLTDQAGRDRLVQLENTARWLPMAVVAPTDGQELPALSTMAAATLTECRGLDSAIAFLLQ
jgi:hypothetical protein